jgi:hypothetical protein
VPCPGGQGRRQGRVTRPWASIPSFHAIHPIPPVQAAGARACCRRRLHAQLCPNLRRSSFGPHPSLPAQQPSDGERPHAVKERVSVEHAARPPQLLGYGNGSPPDAIAAIKSFFLASAPLCSTALDNHAASMHAPMLMLLLFFSPSTRTRVPIIVPAPCTACTSSSYYSCS